VTLDEAEKVQEGPLAEHVQEQCRGREVALVEQRMEGEVCRGEGVGARPSCECALREDLDVSGLVVHVAREPEENLGVARVDLRQEAGRYEERCVLVLGDVGHDLGDRLLCVRRQAGCRLPRDVEGRVPLGPGCSFGQ
jgi:hypothetical protein